jgi:hypothetical protein
MEPGRNTVWDDILAFSRSQKMLARWGYAVGLTKGAVDRPGLGRTHLGAVDQGGDIGWIGVAVAVADEPIACARFEYRCLEGPARRLSVAELATAWTAASSSGFFQLLKSLPFNDVWKTLVTMAKILSIGIIDSGTDIRLTVRFDCRWSR